MLRRIQSFIQQLPTAEKLGFSRYVPLFFLCGASVEYIMINWNPGGNNFYKTYLKRQAHELAIQQLAILGELDNVSPSELED